jgi:hypothetical protein
MVVVPARHEIGYRFHCHRLTFGHISFFFPNQIFSHFSARPNKQFLPTGIIQYSAIGNFSSKRKHGHASFK